MCGRFNIVDSPQVHALLELAGVKVDNLPTRYNIAPTEPVPLLHQFESRTVLSSARWWLTPHWAKQPDTTYAMFNARWEKLNSSPAWKGPFRHHRGFVPASSFIEWKADSRGKQPYLVSLKDQAMAFAALWDLWEKEDSHILSCAIVTHESDERFWDVHQRMPLVLDPQAVQLWLSDGELDIDNPKTLHIDQPFEVQAIDRSINGSRNKEAPRAIGI